MSLDHAVEGLAIDFQQARRGLFVPASVREHFRHVAALNLR
jgi:hypothetical protein